MSLRGPLDMALAARLFDELRQRTADEPGVTRAAYGAGEDLAHAMVRREAARLGLPVATDAAGNLFVTLAGRDPARPAWMVGSHLDSVPHGGNFDGAAGVLAGLCVLDALRAGGRVPARSVVLAAFRAEESTWFPVSYLGSRAALGRLPAAALDSRHSATGDTLRTHLARGGFDPDGVAAGAALWPAARIHAFLELHIEQGPVLEHEARPVGLVSAIAGSVRHRQARCLGAWAHSGAVPRALRSDAVFALADLIGRLDRLWEDILAEGQDCTVTVGEVATDPAQHAFSKVPGEVGFALDLRSPSRACLERLEAGLARAVAAVEEARRVTFDLGPRTSSEPAVLDDGLLDALEAAADRAGIPVRRMPSGAGHDTAALAAAGVPAALVFVRNQNGSHNPAEAMRLEDFEAGCTLMADLIAAAG